MTPKVCSECKNVRYEFVYYKGGDNWNSERKARCVLGHPIKAGCKFSDPCEICACCYKPCGGHHECQRPQRRGKLILCTSCAMKYDENGGYVHVDISSALDITHIVLYAGEKLKVTHDENLAIIGTLDIDPKAAHDLVEIVVNSLVDYTSNGNARPVKADDPPAIRRRGPHLHRLTQRQRAFLLMLDKGDPVIRWNKGLHVTWTAGVTLVTVNLNSVRRLIDRGLVEQESAEGKAEYTITNAGRALIIKGGVR